MDSIFFLSFPIIDFNEPDVFVFNHYLECLGDLLGIYSSPPGNLLSSHRFVLFHQELHYFALTNIIHLLV